MIPSAGHSSPASETQPPDAFVLMRQNPRHRDPSKPRGNSAEIQPPDAFLLATVDDDPIDPTITDQFKNVISNLTLNFF